MDGEPQVSSVRCVAREAKLNLSRVFQGFAASQCGGTLLDKEHVLTAAHCVYHEGRRKVSPGSIVVYVGADSLNDPYATVVRASRVITFSEYDRENPLSYDIAILRLRSPVDYSDKIRPICLPSTNDEPYSGQKLTVAGWGSIDSRDTRTTNLMEVKVDHLPSKSFRPPCTCTHSDDLQGTNAMRSDLPSP